MRIAIIARVYVESALELANLLAQSQHVLLVISGSQNQDLNARIDSRVETEIIPANRNFLKFLYTWRLIRRMRQFRPQIIHFQGVCVKYYFARLFLEKCAVVTTRFGAPGKVRPWKLLSAMSDSLVGWLSHRIILHQTDAGPEADPKLCASSKIRIIPNAQINRFTRWKSEAVVEDPKWILFFERIAPGKGLEYLIRAEPEISRRVRGVKIYIAGRGDAIDPYLAMIEHPASFVILNYRVPEKMVAWLFQKAAMIVLPYKDCKKSRVVRLAFSFAKPVITTPVGCLPKQIVPDQTGVFVPPADSGGLAQAIVGLLHDAKKRRRLGLNGFRSLSRECGRQRLVGLTIQVYREALVEAFSKQEIWNASV